jgi:hypothetical protein
MNNVYLHNRDCDLRQNTPRCPSVKLKRPGMTGPRTPFLWVGLRLPTFPSRFMFPVAEN